jgi:predicted TIM-barrel fold metal-dependent hydrolase
MTEPNYASAASLFGNLPDLRFAICHFASPWDQSPEGIKRWRAAMLNFAALPGAHVKFSGFGMFKPDWSAEDLRPFVEAALDLFGEDRCMAGSNFPVDKLYGRYDRIWAALSEIVGTGETYRKVTLENARKYYRV